MSGYRDTSNYDPMAGGGAYGPPLRRYNWVQWAGVGVLFVGLGIMIAYMAGRAGWIPQWFDSATPGAAFVMLSSVLINSRRQEISAEQFERNRRRGLIAVLVGLVISAVLIGGILVFKGA